MKKTISIISIVIVAILLGWFARGFWDSIFFLEGRVHIVNTFYDNSPILVTFPSGEKIECTLPKGASRNFFIGKTGEGGMKVMVGNKELKCDSYVTTHNDLIVLTITENEVLQSSIYGRLIKLLQSD